MKAKTKFTRLWSILLALVMVVGMLPTVALAAEPATEKADFSTDPTAALNLLNAAKTGKEDSTWDPDTNTLTLNGVNFETTAATAVKLPDGTKIVLNGENTIKGGDAASGACYGIFCEGNLTIQGTGTLNVTGGDAATRSCGIYTDNALTISGGTVTATSGDVSGGASLGIYSMNNITISDEAVVTANGGTATNDGSFGINAEKSVIISGGKVKAIGGAGKGSDGLYSGNGQINISGGKVEAFGGDAPNEGWSVGIFAQTTSANVQISGTADVTAIGGTAKSYYGRSYGIYGKVTLAGGTLTAATKGTTCINGTLNVTGSGVKTISFDRNGGSGKMIAYTNADSYTLPANGFTAPEGKQFKCWSVDGKEKAVGDKITVTADTTVKAVWEDITYTVNVTNGTASPSQAAAGATVTLTANAASTGEAFDKWVAESGNVTLADATGATTTFTMPAGDVSVKATYHTHSYGSEWKSNADKHWHECACGDNSAEAAHTAGDWITDTPATATTVGTKHKECTDCGYVMETGTIPATGYTVSFDANGGTGTMADVTGVSGEYTLPANGFTAPEGKQFKCWSVDGKEKAVGDKITVSADTTVKAVWETIPAAPTEYNILDGANSKWTQDSDGNLSVRGSGAFSEFVGVKVDGKSVDEKYYTVKEGSTIVTLKAGYLNTLTVGSHTLEMIWTDGSASTAFSVNAKSPQTGDNSMMALWIAVLFVSGFGVVATAVCGKKRKSVK